MGGAWVSGKITKTKKIRRRMYYEWVSQQTPKTKKKKMGQVEEGESKAKSRRRK